MRNYEEMSKNVLERVHNYESKKITKAKSKIKKMEMLIPVCAAAIVGVGIWYSGILSSPPERKNDTDTFITDTETTTVYTYTCLLKSSCSTQTQITTFTASVNNKKSASTPLPVSTYAKENSEKTTLTEKNEEYETNNDTEEEILSPKNSASPSEIPKTTAAVQTTKIINTATQTAKKAVTTSAPPVTEPIVSPEPQTPNYFCMLVPMINFNGETYIGNDTLSNDYTEKEFIGLAEEFDGQYLTTEQWAERQKEISEAKKTNRQPYLWATYCIFPSDADIYTVNETDDILLAVNPEGSVIVLKSIGHLLDDEIEELDNN